MLVGHCIRMLGMWLRYRDGVCELSRLSDRELADIGLHRSEIDGIAWRAARSSRVKPASLLRGD